MAYAQANMFYERERWGKPLALSVGFHVLVVLTLFVLGFLMNPNGKSDWGENQGDAVDAKLVSSASIPIPHPEVQTDNIVADDTKNVTPAVPQPKPVETDDGVTIPGHVIKPKIDKPMTTTNVKPRPTPVPSTAVGYDTGAVASGPYSAFTAPNTRGGFSAMNAGFGNKWPSYVDAVRRTVQNNWLLYEIDPHINAPHRAYVDFDIERDGTPSNIRLVQSSGVPTLDQSAMRALQRVDKFGALPEGSKQTFEFWFDYPPKQ
jgi:periplasmic protein TonB